ncbi:transposase [Lancefieldella rimae]|uniref:transposase n=1 Tax=Lancefieldella rimae TaxID=1383 RepID=UPI0037BF4F83
MVSELKSIWLAPDDTVARESVESFIEKYQKRFPEAIHCLEDGLEDLLTFYTYPEPDHRKISSSNMIERLNREIRRRTHAVGVFPNEASYIRLVTTYLMEYAEDLSTSRAYIREGSLTTLLGNTAAENSTRLYGNFCEHCLKGFSGCFFYRYRSLSGNDSDCERQKNYQCGLCDWRL